MNGLSWDELPGNAADDIADAYAEVGLLVHYLDIEEETLDTFIAREYLSVAITFAQRALDALAEG